MKRIISVIASEEVKRILQRLYGTKDLDTRIEKYYIDKLKIVVFVVLTGLIISCIYKSSVSNKSEIKPGNRIYRNNYEEGDKTVELQVNNKELDISEKICITVDDIKYSEDEIVKKSKELKRILEKEILLQNESFEHITGDFYFPEKIDGYPFHLTYETDRPLLVERNGKVNFDRLLEETDESDNSVIITVSLKYKDYEEKVNFGVWILPKEKTYKEKFLEYLMLKINQNNEDTEEQYYMNLPDKVGRFDVEYSENDENIGELFVFISILSGLLIYLGKDRDLRKLDAERNQQMIADYPGLINRFALFYSAGIPVKTIWHKLCEEYVNERDKSNIIKYVYEEMLISDIYMNEGGKEVDAYEEFASRIGIAKYRYFVSVLIQSVKKGKRDVENIFNYEAREAFEDRKLRARRLSEEASTKLLVPMFMMLIVVVIMIVFPAFYSFRM